MNVVVFMPRIDKFEVYFTLFVIFHGLYFVFFCQSLKIIAIYKTDKHMIIKKDYQEYATNST